MTWCNRLLGTRFDCFDKRDRLLLKTLLKNGAIGTIPSKQLKTMNRWRLYPLLAPFNDEENVQMVYKLTLGCFLQRFFAVSGKDIESPQTQNTVSQAWLKQVFTFQQLKQQSFLPTKLVQTTWNIEGEKQLCFSHFEI